MQWRRAAVGRNTTTTQPVRGKGQEGRRASHESETETGERGERGEGRGRASTRITTSRRPKTQSSRRQAKGRWVAYKPHATTFLSHAHTHSPPTHARLVVAISFCIVTECHPSSSRDQTLKRPCASPTHTDPSPVFCSSTTPGPLIRLAGKLSTRH
ncbi:hypothetical protein COCVIDRAFT_112151 [Bipolaris victoriae FI3]|uniref:Uncharacterized protein n=1 Tax=Bipolaris victoriae (strain FI3) TaxID=930091 RepID=W7DVM5_BIPV3|nr:hypothetical protein COCVIDRAFT_112151 [Bipolaris victoriae FI3]